MNDSNGIDWLAWATLVVIVLTAFLSHRSVQRSVQRIDNDVKGLNNDVKGINNSVQTLLGLFNRMLGYLPGKEHAPISPVFPENSVKDLNNIEANSPLSLTKKA